jgi:hypothetical protein
MPVTYMLPGIKPDISEPGTPPSTLVPQTLATANNLKAMKNEISSQTHAHPLNTYIS